jgi:hypothetical protein
VVVVSGGWVVVVSGGLVVVVVCFAVVVVVCFGLVVVVVVAGGGKKKTGVVVVVVVCFGLVVVEVLLAGGDVVDEDEVFPAGMIGKTALTGAVWTLLEVDVLVLAAVLAEALVLVVAAVVGVVAGVPVVEVDDGGGTSTGSCAPVDLVTLPLVACDAPLAPGS